jgi:hypothetical protein
MNHPNPFEMAKCHIMRGFEEAADAHVDADAYTKAAAAMLLFSGFAMQKNTEGMEGAVAWVEDVLSAFATKCAERGWACKIQVGRVDAPREDGDDGPGAIPPACQRG